MPDRAKLQSLAAVGYQIQRVCGTCQYGLFAAGSPWGCCSGLLYQHRRHRGKKLPSTYVAGSCHRHVYRNAVMEDLERSGFGRFAGALTERPSTG